jgi:glycosyltransferase domain-containing protein
MIPKRKMSAEQQKLLDKVTIVIPTYNRPGYLKRLLDYYSAFDVDVVVSDSSKEAFDGLAGFRRVRYFHYPSLDMVDKLALTLKKIRTKYLVFCGDDDFIIVESVCECIRFLEENPDYASAQGYYTSFYKKKKRAVYGPSYLHIIGFDNNSPSAETRVRTQLLNYMDTLYSVQRTANMRQIYAYAYRKVSDYNLMELIVTIGTLINGKHRVLPIFYCARESVDGSYSDFTVNLDQIAVMGSFAEQYGHFGDILTAHYARRAGTSKENAKKIISHLLDEYINMHRMVKSSARMKVIGKIDHVSAVAGRGMRYLYFELKRIRNIRLVRKTTGFPYDDKEARKQLEEIDSFIMKHNLPSKWKVIMV